MKKIITAIAFALATTTTSFAADFVNVTKVSTNNNITTVSIDRTYVDNNGRENLLMTSVYRFRNNLSIQETINKVALLCDGNITVRTSLASTTSKVGQAGVLAQKRSEAWQKGGLTAYMVELTRQLEDEGVLW